MTKAQKGDLICIVNAKNTCGAYKNGDILEVTSVEGDYTYVKGEFEDGSGLWLEEKEYEIFRKVGEEDSLISSADRLVNRIHALVVSEQVKKDAVNHPNHYTQGRFETIELIEEVTQGYSDGYAAYCVGNALKYLARAPFKHGEPVEDLQKAAKYLEFAIERVTKN